MNWTDKIKIFNEDCMELMKRYPDNYFDLAIVDPPYLEDTKNLDNYLNKMRVHGYNLTTLQKPPKKEYFKELFRVSKNQIIWGGNYFIDLWQSPCRGFIFWYKQNPVNNFADGEFAWTSFDENAKCFHYKYYGNLEGNTSASKKIHPTQKPRSLYKWLLDNYAKPEFKILDTHLGSGNHAVEAHFFGVKEFVAAELEKQYFDDSYKYFKQQISQQVLF